ncbi:MAG: hypothetical protein RI908_457, partial [Actinomycetota bacterium]
WDYLASVHICAEAGAIVGEQNGRELVVTSHGERRSPIVAATDSLLDQASRIRDNG